MLRLLVVVDATAESAEVLDRAIEIAAAAAGSELVLLGVAPEPPAWTHARPAGSREAIDGILARAQAAAAVRGIPAKIRIETGEKADVVTHVAGQEKCDQIFVSEGPATWVARTLMALSAACTGRSAGRIISDAGIPVTVIAAKHLP